MKKTKYYLKLGKSQSTFGKNLIRTHIDDEIDDLMVDPNEWLREFGWEFIESNKVNLYMDKGLNQLYCYERPTKLLREEWSQSMYSLHSPDLMIDYEEDVEIKKTVTKLATDTRYKNGYNWKNAHIKGANSSLGKPNPSANPYNKLNPKGKPPINPRTGRRDGGV